MSKVNQSKIDVRISNDTKNQYDILKGYYNIKGPELLEKIINNEYRNVFINNGMGIDTKKECLKHMCIIIDSANVISNDDIRVKIIEEVNEVCHLLS